MVLTFSTSRLCLVSAGKEAWQPLLKAGFLESLWQKLVRLWQDLGFQPAGGPAPDHAPSAALVQYVQSGSYPQLSRSGAGPLLIFARPTWQLLPEVQAQS